MLRELRRALVVFGLLTVVTGAVYPGVVTLIGIAAFSHEARGSVVLREATHRRLGASRTVLHGSEVFLEPALGHGSAIAQRRGIVGFQPRADQRGARRGRSRSRRRASRRGSWQPSAGSGRSCDRLWQRPRSPHFHSGGGIPARPRGSHSRDDGRRDARARRGIHRTQDARPAGRASRKRATSEPRARFTALNEKDKLIYGR